MGVLYDVPIQIGFVKPLEALRYFGKPLYSRNFAKPLEPSYTPTYAHFYFSFPYIYEEGSQITTEELYECLTKGLHKTLCEAP